MATKKTTKAVKKTDAETIEAIVYNLQGKESGKVALSNELFSTPWNADLVHQVITSMQSNARQGGAHAKTRAEVRGGGKKPWKQKGTGRARHGSTRSPIWIGGGTTHGPRNDKNYDKKISKSMRMKAFSMILSKKWKDGEIVFIDSLSMKEPKTQMAVDALKGISTVKGFETLSSKRKNAALIGIPAAEKNIHKSFRNIGSVVVDDIRNWNPVELITNKYAVIVDPAASLKVLEAKLA